MKATRLILVAFLAMWTYAAGAQDFDGLDFGLSHDFNIKDIATLSVNGHLICNPTGVTDKGEAYVLGGVSI